MFFEFGQYKVVYIYAVALTTTTMETMTKWSRTHEQQPFMQGCVRMMLSGKQEAARSRIGSLAAAPFQPFQRHGGFSE
jgi:hypothetical protein